MDEKTREWFRQHGLAGAKKLREKYGPNAHAIIGRRGAKIKKQKNYPQMSSHVGLDKK